MVCNTSHYFAEIDRKRLLLSDEYAEPEEENLIIGFINYEHGGGNDAVEDLETTIRSTLFRRRLTRRIV